MLSKTADPPPFFYKKGGRMLHRSNSPPLFPNVRPRVACPPALPIISLRKYFPPIPGPFRPREAGGGPKGGGGRVILIIKWPPPSLPPPPFMLCGEWRGGEEGGGGPFFNKMTEGGGHLCDRGGRERPFKGLCLPHPPPPLLVLS
nr:hypothetical protein [Morchella crassipes]